MPDEIDWGNYFPPEGEGGQTESEGIAPVQPTLSIVPDVPEDTPPPAPPTKTSVPLTREDAHNGDYFEAEFGKNVAYDHPTKVWYIWHKGAHRWREDENEHIRVIATNAAKRRIDDCVRAGDAEKARIALSLLSLDKRKAALEDLRFHPGVAIGQQHWDMNTDLFCVRNGVIELRTGRFRAGTQTDAITKQSAVTYDAAAVCPRWMRFLTEVFVTPEMVEYVRTIVGYCMTGLTIEQVWFLLYGTGGNGKSVFVAVLRAIFGIKQYYEEAAAETFIVGQWGPSAGHNISQLRSARLVVASEVPERVSFDGARIKQLTGSDPVTSAAKYENNVTFIPQLKLMMLVNHLPSTRDDSLGFWRRLRPIPFEVTFDGQSADEHLLDTLLGELPGILNWCLSGAVDWFASGLAPEPANAHQLGTEYRAESDPLAMFIHECVVVTRVQTDTVQSRELYRVYVAWCRDSKHQPMNETNFGRSSTIKSLGSGKTRTNTGSVISGVKVYEPGEHMVKMPKSGE